MFYAQFVLAKKGPLARIWLAAHWDKKLTKAHVFETNIEKSVDGILQPKIKMALRTSGHLLLGVVRIYSRKAKYLLADCNEAFVKIKMAFRPGMVDLPDDIREAAVSAITLPEVFHDFDTPMADLNDVDIQAQFTLNQSRAEEITMREDYANISLVTNDVGFGDMGFEEPPELMRGASAMEQSLDHQNLMFGESSVLDKDKEEPSTSKIEDTHMAHGRVNNSALDLEAPIRDDGFGGNLGLFEGGLFDDTPIVDGPSLDASGVQDDQMDALPPMMDEQQLQPVAAQLPEEAAVPATAPQDTATKDTATKDTATKDTATTDQQAAPATEGQQDEVKTEDSDDDGADDRFGGPQSVSPPCSENGSRPTSPRPGATSTAFDMPPPAAPEVEADAAATTAADAPTAGSSADAPAAPMEEPEATSAQDMTTLVANDKETFTLDPVDTTAIRYGMPRVKRKRKLIVDEVKNISGEEMKAQLSDTTDIVNTLDLAPPTKRLMHWKETGGVEKLFALPGRAIYARLLGKMYQRHLTSQPTQNEDFGMAGDKELENLRLEQVRDADDMEGIEKPAGKPRGRPAKRKQPDHNDSNDEEQELSRTRKSRHSEPDELGHLDDPLMSPPPSMAPLTPAPPPSVPPPETPVASVDVAVSDVAAVAVSSSSEQQPAPTRPSVEESFNQLMADHNQAHPEDNDVEALPTPAAPTTDVAPAAAAPDSTAADGTATVAADSTAAVAIDGTTAVAIDGTTAVAADSTAADSTAAVTDTAAAANVTDPAAAATTQAPGTENPPAAPTVEEEGPPPSVAAPAGDNPATDAASAPVVPMEVDGVPPVVDVVPVEQPNTAAETPAPPAPAAAAIDLTNGLHQPVIESADKSIMDAMMSHQTPVVSTAPAAPFSPPPASPTTNEEEQAEDETNEEFEERVVNKRAAHTFRQIRKSLRNNTLVFSEMIKGQKRKHVARTFYTMLVLKKLQAVELQQDGCFQEMYVARGALFDKARI